MISSEISRTARGYKNALDGYTDYRTNLVQFAIDKCGMKPTREQRMIMEALTPKNPYSFQIKECDISGHNIGKTALVGVVVPWFFKCYPQSRAVTTAPNFKKQVEKQSWAEVHKWGNFLREDGFRLLDTEVKDPRSNSHYAVGVPSYDEDEFRGFHELTGLMMVFEEGSGIEDRIYKAAEGSQQHNYIFWIITNPGAPRGYVYDIAMGRKKGWNVQWFNSEEAELPDPCWIQQMAEDYGKDSPTYAMKVLGRFPDIGEDSVHSLSAIEYATGERVINGQYISPPKHDSPDVFAIGCDVAEWGSDMTVITGAAIKFASKGRIPKWCVITNCEAYGKQDVDFTKNELIRKTDEWVTQFKNDPIRVSSIDRIGVGSGAYSGILRYLREIRRKTGKAPPWRIVDFVGSAGSNEPQTYANLKAESQFTFRDWMKAGVVSFDDRIDSYTRDRFKGDWLVYKYDYDNQGRYIVIDPRSAKAAHKYDKSEKLDIKSPDYGDTTGQIANIIRSRRGIGRQASRITTETDTKDQGPTIATVRRLTPGDLLD